jgi:hypothetical protein
VQPLGGADEVAGGDDGEKGARELGFQPWMSFISDLPILKRIIFRLPNVMAVPT